MPRTEVVFYRDDDGSVPALEWIDGLSVKARLKCLDRLRRLRDQGHELRRPEADYLRDGIHELRISLNHIQYRLLYAFSTRSSSGRKKDVTVNRRTIAVVAHGITKEGRVPDQEIERALRRMRKFTADSVSHTFMEPENG
jgi:Phage derived protein Gp49-like (DUF891)